MAFKAAFWVFVKCESIKITDEALVCFIIHNETLLLSQLRKGIDYDAKENVEPDDLYNNEEGNVVEQLDQVDLRIVFVVDRSCHITDTTTFVHTHSENSEETLKHWGTLIFTHPIRVKTKDWIVVYGVLEVEKGDNCVNVHYNQTQHECHEKLSSVAGHRFYYILKNWGPLDYV